MGIIRRLWRERAGAASIEFAMVAIPFVVMIFGGIQLVIIMLTQQMIETTAEAVGRKILTGYVQTNSLSQTQFVQMVCGLLPSTLNCNRLIIDVNVATNFSSATTSRPAIATLGNPTSTKVLTYNPGIAGNIVVLRLMYALPTVSLPGLNLQQSSTYGLSYPMATAVFKNEAF